MNSRYYNPIWGRYLNADSLAGNIGELLSHNVFAYCKNNAVILQDPSGNRSIFSKMWEVAKNIANNVMECAGKVTQFLTPSTQTKIAIGIIAGVIGYKLIKPQKVSAKNKTKFTNVKEAAENIKETFNGTLTSAKGKGYKIEIPINRKTITIRAMEAGSGGRENPYFRVSISGKGSLTLEGKISNDRFLTHIDFGDNYILQIENMLKIFKGSE